MIQNSSGTPPKVAHLIRSAPGGTRELVRTLLLAAPPDSPPSLFAPEETLSALADAVKESGRHALHIESSQAYHQLAAGQVAGRIARREGAGLIHGHGFRYAPLFAAASLASGLPLVVSLHNLVPSDLTGLQRAAAKTALGRASAVIAVSKAVADSAAGVVPDRERIVTIPNGVDISRFTANGDERSGRRKAMRESLGIAPDARLVVCLARLSPEKNIANLLEAFALIAPRFPEARLCIAGEGRLRKTLAWYVDLLALNGKAILPGVFPRGQVADLLYAADIFALSSREEGLSLAVIEAMAAGLPVVATAVGGLPEAIRGGETGILTPPNDPVTFAAALADLLADPVRSKTMGKAGATRASEHFAESAMIASHLALYERILREQ